MAGEFPHSPGFKNRSFIDDMAYGGQSVEAYTDVDEFERDHQEREATQRAIRNVIGDAVSEDGPEDKLAADVPRERGLYEDLYARDRTKGPFQSRKIGGMPGGGGW